MSGARARHHLVVGRAYLDSQPDEASAERLASLLGIAVPERAADLDALRAGPWLRERVADDFRAGRVAMVRGWMLARTEARWWALTALLGAGLDAGGPAVPARH